MHLKPNALKIQDNVGYVLLDSRDGGKFVEHPFDSNGGDCTPLERRKEDSPERIAERRAETALERLGIEFTIGV